RTPSWSWGTGRRTPGPACPEPASTSSRAAPRCGTTGRAGHDPRRGVGTGGPGSADPRRPAQHCGGRRAGRAARAAPVLLHQSVELPLRGAGGRLPRAGRPPDPVVGRRPRGGRVLPRDDRDRLRPAGGAAGRATALGPRLDGDRAAPPGTARGAGRLGAHAAQAHALGRADPVVAAVSGGVPGAHLGARRVHRLVPLRVPRPHRLLLGAGAAHHGRGADRLRDGRCGRAPARGTGPPARGPGRRRSRPGGRIPSYREGMSTATFDPTGLEPLSATDEQRAMGPLARTPQGTWVVLGHEEAMAVATDHETFSSAVSRFLQVPNGLDGTEHAAFRAVTDPFFDRARMRALEPTVRGIATELLEELLADVGPVGTEIDAVAALGAVFAVRAQTAWLGWPSRLEPELLQWMVDNHEASRSGELARTAEVAERFDAIIRSVVAPRRALGAD